MFKTVLIANRGEIAVRIAATLKKMGIKSVAVYSDPDRASKHVTAADIAIPLDGMSAADTYLRSDKILAAAKETGAEAIIPGYGFLSENAGFAEECEKAGIAFVGPTPEQIRSFGLKHTSREIAMQADVPLTPGTGLLASLDEAKAAAAKIGFPLMLKSTAGGGGIGMTRCSDEAELVAAFDSVKRMAQNFFKDTGVFLERYVDGARHVEVQIFGDGNGNVVALGERDCSLQRRNQKVVEETPAPDLPSATREKLLAASEKLAKAVSYRSAGTIEYIYDRKRDEFYFLEVNTRLQVEHPVTESVLGLDLVEWMIKIAAGEPPIFAKKYEPKGASIEVRIYAEDPVKNFQPSPGVLTEVFFPPDARVDTWVATGTEVSPYYDPMIAKLIVHGKDRSDAIKKMITALNATSLAGIATNVDYLRQVVAWKDFADGEVSTSALSRFKFEPPVIEVIEPGTYSTIQDYPGRIGYWSIGVSPAGPMDDYAFRIANRIVGNDEKAAGLESTIQGATLRFHKDCLIALTGADSGATLDDKPCDFWKPVQAKAGQVLKMGRAKTGCRIYLAIRQGFDVPVYLGSRSTFALGQFGGHAGRPLRAGDMLLISNPEIPACKSPPAKYEPKAAPESLIPSYDVKEWEIGCLYGPHGAPDFFTYNAVETFFASTYQVHYNSNRLGIRLNGPKPEWTRSDGGEAGLHPSNVHDCEYAIGSVNFTGDLPVILTRDGPSLGGFVCPVTIAKGELWKVGQVKPGDSIRFVPMTFDDALALEKAQDAAIAALEPLAALPARKTPELKAGKTVSSTVIAELPAKETRPAVAYRQAGDKYILLEYGPMALDLRFRFRVHALMEELKKNPVEGILELSPGVRSLQINYDSRVITQSKLIDALLQAEEVLPRVDTMKVDTRIVHLPMAFEDSATLDAVAKYRQSVRDTAPWLPNNVDFIQRLNGLKSRDDVRDIVFKTSYMVLGLGDVYLGAPCAVPVDPRHRLLTSKYNPARTFTAEGTVGIGGVYMCIYGMDSPGGYQLIGRTLPIWNKFLLNPTFEKGEPWLLKFFDQVRFYPVSEEELTEHRQAFREGRATIKIEHEVFDLAEHENFLEENAASIASFKEQQQAAFTKEVAVWQATEATAATAAALAEPEKDIGEIDGQLISSDISGNIWKLLVEVGQSVEAGAPVAIVEAMKMEFPVAAPSAGKVSAIYCKPGKQVGPGDPLLAIKAA